MSTQDIRNIIARGKDLTGRKLRTAIEAATGSVVGGRGIKVTSVNGSTVVSLKRQPVVGKAEAGPFHVRLTDVFPLPPNRWLYSWEEVQMEDGLSWAVIVGGRSSTDAGNTFAWNYAEMKNTATEVLHGVDLTNLPGDVVLLPATAGSAAGVDQVVPLNEVKALDGTKQFWFYVLNGIEVTCPPVPALASGSFFGTELLT